MNKKKPAEICLIVALGVIFFLVSSFLHILLVKTLKAKIVYIRFGTALPILTLSIIELSSFVRHFVVLLTPLLLVVLGVLIVPAFTAKNRVRLVNIYTAIAVFLFAAVLISELALRLPVMRAKRYLAPAQQAALDKEIAMALK